MKSSLINHVAGILGLDDKTVAALAKRAPVTYRHYQIKKKRGGTRTIFHPAKETKSIQYSLIVLLREALTPHNSAIGYIRGLRSPLLANAKTHAPNPYIIRVDFRDFFPSINPQDLFEALTSATNPKRISLSPEECTFLQESLFVKTAGDSWGLPIGAPSSPVISNGVMRNLDVIIKTTADQYNFAYTRYADDLIFSTKEKGTSKDFLKILERIIAENVHPKLQIHNAKTLFMDRSSRRMVTGLTISPNGTISIGRHRKRYIRKMVHDYENKKLDAHHRKALQGHLAYILDIDPLFYNSLCQKRGAHVISSALTGNS